MSADQPPEHDEDISKEALPPELQQALAGLITAGALGPEGVEMITTPEHIIATLTALARQIDQPYDMLTDMCGVDQGDELQVVYRLYRRYSAEAAVVKVTIPRSAPRLPTATGLWALANWAEREIADMFGIIFEGHPDPRPLLLPDDFAGSPLRKDYEYPKDHPYLCRDPAREDLGPVSQSASRSETNQAG